MIAEESSSRGEVQTVDGPDIGVIVAVELLTIPILNPHIPQHGHLQPKDGDR